MSSQGTEAKLLANNADQLSIRIDEEAPEDLENDTDETRRNERLFKWAARKWDVFEETPRKDDGDGLNTETIEKILKVIKVLTYIVSFIFVLGSSVVSKLSLLMMTSLAAPAPRDVEFIDNVQTFKITITPEEQISWIWCLFFIMIAPEILTFLKCSKWCFFKSFEKPQRESFILVMLTEGLQAFGLSVLVFIVLPNLTAVRGAMVTNTLCFIPCLLSCLSRRRQENNFWLKMILDVLALLSQASVFGAFLYRKDNLTWIIPLTSVFVSLSWWENFLNKNSSLKVVQVLTRIRDDIDRSRSFSFLLLSIWRIVVIFCSMVLIVHSTGEGNLLFENFGDIFNDNKLKRYQKIVSHWIDAGYISSSDWNPVCLTLIQISSSVICYLFVKFACKTCIQGIGFALPISMTIPVTISILIIACRYKNEIFENTTIPPYLFWNCIDKEFLSDFIVTDHGWLWLLWVLSQIWVTVHIWIPKFSRVGHRLFVRAMYCGIVLDQSLTLNRWRDENEEDGYDQLEEEEDDFSELDPVPNPVDLASFYETPVGRETTFVNLQPSLNNDEPQRSDYITRIYMCATMWHETAEEMTQMLKSMFRMDEDQCARRLARQTLGYVKDENYYTCETHFFFDDAFERRKLPNKERVSVVNRFVKQLVDVIDKAASEVHKCNIVLKPPRKIPTPHGGRLEWILPGRTKLFVHLKDKMKIRHRKRWSQVMYMYYLLGFRLMDRPISTKRKDIMASRTFILALDGDVDFRPTAVQRLVDLMVKHPDLGAACGRIHPIGRGPMVWYQKYEYAIGHWLQKATEHMIGCVLCSPGCFSLFRAEALMDSNVMKKYTTQPQEALHYVQYDQGEDRWLCTLLLKQGYRIEYSAASDALTQCPEGFGEFFSQRRRWGPSTIANVMDLLLDYKHTVKANNNISFLYILYQVLMMVGGLLGPGNIFLMLVGSMVAAFKVSNLYAFNLNIVPIMLFIIICFVTKNDTQVLVAQILSALYALLMMAVLVGTAVELAGDGIGSPTAIFLIVLAGSSILAALLHPQEFSCIYSSLLYFLSIPAMYLLLTIYSFINLNCISWGTREVEPTEDEEDEKKTKAVEEAVAATKNTDQATNNAVLRWLGFTSSKKEEEGSVSCGLANLFKIMCCTYPKPSDEKYLLIGVDRKLEDLQKQISNLEKISECGRDSRQNSLKRRSSLALSRTMRRLQQQNQLSETILEDEELENDFDAILEDEVSNNKDTEDDTNQTPPVVRRDDLINPYWLEDLNEYCADKEELYREEYFPEFDDQDPRDISDMERDAENTFFQELIKKYLHPLDEDKDQKKRISQELKDLRNKVVFAVLMMNAIFVLIVMLLQSHKDKLHVKWPLGVKLDIKYIPKGKTGEIVIEKKHLELDPVGLVFVFCFTVILLVQFVAMLFHRLETFTTIMADVSLSLCGRKGKDIKGDPFLRNNAVKLVREIQRLDKAFDNKKEIGEEQNQAESTDQQSQSSPQNPMLPKRRMTVHNLANKVAQKPIVTTLDEVFAKNYQDLLHKAENEGNQNLKNASPIVKEALGRRNTLQFLQKRRNTLSSVSTPILSRNSTFTGRNSTFTGTDSVRSNVSGFSRVSFANGSAVVFPDIVKEEDENHSENSDQETRF